MGLVTKAEYDAQCKDSKNICLFLFGEQAALKDKVSALMKEYASKPITFFFSSVASQPAFAKQFGITQEPALLMVHGKRSRFEAVLEGLSESYLEEKVAAVMAGERNNFANFEFQVTMS